MFLIKFLRNRKLPDKVNLYLLVFDYKSKNSYLLWFSLIRTIIIMLSISLRKK